MFGFILHAILALAAAVSRLREEGTGGRLDQVEGAERVIRAVISRVPVPGVGEGATAGWGPEVPWRISEF